MKFITRLILMVWMLILQPLSAFEQTSAVSINGNEVQVKSPGDAQYRETGDRNVLEKGKYVTGDLNVAFQSIPKVKDGAKIGGSNLNLGYGVFRIKLAESRFNIRDHNTWVVGRGMGTTTLHIESDGNDNTPSLAFDRKAGPSMDALLRGGGIKDLTLKTDNSKIANFGLQLNYVEYMSFENLVMENFNKSALMGCFWESNFDNITIRSSGAGNKVINGIPDFGVIDFDSHASNNLRDAPNNTNFNKVTFSSCWGTHIRAVAFANSIVNINFFGLYDETYPADGGDVDEMPIYYFKGVKNFNVTGGFLTVNTTEKDRSAYAVRVASDGRNGPISFNNFEFLLNYKGELYAQNQTRRLNSFIYLERNQQITLNNVIINDASGSIGLKLPEKYLIDGEPGSMVNLSNVKFLVKKGVWNINNIISPRVSRQGNISITFYDDKGPTGEVEHYTYQIGKILRGDSGN